MCGLDGRCGRLAAPDGAQFAGSEWLYASDWGIAGPSETPLGDRLRIGGDSADETLLAFTPVPDAGELLRAVLVLRRHSTATPLTEPTEIIIESGGAFRGGVLPPRGSATPARYAAARRNLPVGPAHDLRVDVTEAVRHAAGRDDRTVYLLLRASGGGPQYFASPQHAAPDRRPRLELMVH